MSYKNLKRIERALTEIDNANKEALILFATLREDKSWQLRGANSKKNVYEEFTSEQDLDTWLEKHESDLCIKIVYRDTFVLESDGNV